MRFLVILCLLVSMSSNVFAAEKAFSDGIHFFANLLETYYRQNRKYASSDGSRRFTDIGLRPGDWEGVSFQGIVYQPYGDRLEIHPGEGYTFFVKTPSGATRILSHNLGWSLIYNLSDKKWYFHRIESSQEVDISTLLIKKDTPYNPEAYK